MLTVLMASGVCWVLGVVGLACVLFGGSDPDQPA